MCYSAGIKKESLQKFIQKEKLKRSRYDYSYYEKVSAIESPLFPVLRMDSPHRIHPMHWLFTPPWFTRSEQLKGRKIWAANVRIEEAEKKKLYAPAVEQKRCVVLFSHFFEWRHEEKKKIQYKIRLKNDEPLLLPGLYSETVIDGKPWLSFGVCTMEAQNIMRYIHNTALRQPVVIDTDQMACWLNPEIPFDEARRMILEKERSADFIPEPPIEASPPGQIDWFSEGVF